MNRYMFMDELARRLAGLPPSERDAALSFYNELFDEAGSENEGKVIDELGSPYQVAAKILAEFAAEQTLGQNQYSHSYHGGYWHGYQTPKRRISWLWYLLIGILAAPVALPIAVAAITGVLGVLIGLIAAIIAVGATILAWVIASGALFVAGIYTLLLFPAAGMCMVGVSLIMIAIALLIFLPVRWLLTWLFDLATRGTAYIFNRISGGARA